ncbi:MAG: magnesium-translocating P-type ATPase [Saprospiraceae bacterium]|jgi:Mg2+-importing ATPase
MTDKHATDLKNEDLNCFWQYGIEYWYKRFSVSENGLSGLQASTYLSKSVNIRKSGQFINSDLSLFIGQFTNPLMLLLIGAILLSAFLGDISDVAIISLIVLSAGILSFVQERNAGKVAQQLKSLISVKSKVIREGQYIDIPSESIVPGDVIILNAGAIIPADCLLITSNELNVNEASLTGESFPVRKEIGVIKSDAILSQRTNCLWEGTNVVSGKAKALVINTGDQTLFGDIVTRSGTNVASAFEIGIKDFGFFLMKITLVLSVFILVVNLINEKSIIESTLFALALAVGMAPELLPAITTIAMSSGAKRLLAKKVIVKKLSSIQNLGEVNLLCTDKTGTITEGKIIIDKITDYEGNDSDYTRQLAIWNSIFETGYTNPIDEALKALGDHSNINITKIGEIPFDFLRKRISIAVDTGSEKILISKGAFEQILETCSKLRSADGSVCSIDIYKSNIRNLFEEYSLNGNRVIGVSFKRITENYIDREDEKEMIFSGLILLKDPIKAGIAEAIDELKKLHIGLKIITGDNRNVARSIANSLGIHQPLLMTGQELQMTSSEALVQKIKKIHIFAEIEPQQKERIILALRKTYTVAYMGDGINDVSAINAADVGISVENSVDIAREAADFVLMEKDLSVLVEGIKEGRKTFANTLKYIYISTGSTFGNMCSVALASIILPFLPMLPKQILLTNFITDFPYMMIASDNVDQEQLNKPGKWKLKIINRYMVIFGIHSSFFDLITFVVLWFILKVQESAFQTGWFIESVFSELCILFIIRTHKSFLKSRPSNYLFVLSIMGLVLTLFLPYFPFAAYFGLVKLSLLQVTCMFGIVTLYIITADLLKIWFFNKYAKA